MVNFGKHIILNIIKYKRIIFTILIFILFLSTLFFIKDYHNKSVKIKTLEAQMKECQILNQKLADTIKLSQEKYQQKVSELMKLASKPPQKIEIPVVIEKPIPITSEECQKMGYMVDEFIRIQREGK